MPKSLKERKRGGWEQSLCWSVEALMVSKMGALLLDSLRAGIEMGKRKRTAIFL